MAQSVRGLFNEEMLGADLNTNSRTIFPEEFDDAIVMEDTKEWVQRGTDDLSRFISLERELHSCMLFFAGPDTSVLNRILHCLQSSPILVFAPSR